MELIMKIEHKVLLSRLITKTEYEMMFKNQKIIFRMRLQGSPFPKIVYKIIVEQANVIHLNPRNSKSANHWRLLNVDSILLRKQPSNPKRPVQISSQMQYLKSNILQFELPDLNHFVMEADVTINDLLN